MSDFPLRLRLHGGRNTHAAHVVNGGEDDSVFTACGHIAVERDKQLDGSEPVTCRPCQQRTKVPR